MRANQPKTDAIGLDANHISRPSAIQVPVRKSSPAAPNDQTTRAPTKVAALPAWQNRERPPPAPRPAVIRHAMRRASETLRAPACDSRPSYPADAQQATSHAAAA